MLPLLFLNSLTVELPCLFEANMQQTRPLPRQGLVYWVIPPNAMALVGFNYLFAMANCHKN